jgi:hypothetical protein
MKKEAEGCFIDGATANDYIHKEMIKQVTKSHVRDAVHKIHVN